MISQSIKPISSSGKGGATAFNSSAKTMSQETAENPPRFLVIKRTDGADFSKVSPFLIQKTMYGLVGEVKLIKKIGEGLLVETSSFAQSRRLLKVVVFSNYPVIVNSHGSLNSSKGVIYCRDLLNCSITEIEENLNESGVINVKRIQTRRNGILIDTPNLILTFNTPKLPKYIVAAMYKLEVRPFIPNPVRCFRCQRFGHTSSKCNSEEICICGIPKHEGFACDDPVCVNCKGNHFAQDRDCPKYKEEAAIQKIKVIENVDYREARKRVMVSHPSPGITYAQSVQSTLKDNLKNILDELMPEIIKTCVTLIKQETQSTATSTFKNPTIGSPSKGAVSKTKIQSSRSRSQERDKRKADETDESDIQSSSSQMSQPVKRRPGRPPKMKTPIQNLQRELEIETNDSHLESLMQLPSSQLPN